MHILTRLLALTLASDIPGRASLDPLGERGYEYEWSRLFPGLPICGRGMFKVSLRWGAKILKLPRYRGSWEHLHREKLSYTFWRKEGVALLPTEFLSNGIQIQPRAARQGYQEALAALVSQYAYLDDTWDDMDESLDLHRGNIGKYQGRWVLLDW